MVEETEVNKVQEEVQKPKSDGQKQIKQTFIGKSFLIGILVFVLMIASAAGAYYWRDSTAKDTEKQQSDSALRDKNAIASLTKQLADKTGQIVTDNKVVADDKVVTPCTETAPKASTIENIKASITSGNTAALEGYMASSVNVILAATEAYGSQTPTQAVSDITTFISDDINSWDYNFALPAATLNAYAQNDYSQYFPTNAIVGKATNDQVISFSFDCNGKIDTVFMSGSSSLL